MTATRTRPPPLRRLTANLTPAFAVVLGTVLLGGGGLLLPSSDATPLHEAVFPPNDEYDPLVFDPLSAFGAPYGGYARAARSRLAKLPLRLVGGGEFEGMPAPVGASASASEGGTTGSGSGSSGATEKDGDAAAASSSGAPHFKMSDSDGRQFVCRVYHEEELDPFSVLGSMFDYPERRTVPLASADAEKGGGTAEDVDDDDEEEYYDEDEYYHDHGDSRGSLQYGEKQIAYSDPSGNFKAIGDQDGMGPGAGAGGADRRQQGQTTGGGAGHGADRPQTHHHHPVTVHPNDINRQLAKLDNVCAQLHPGWWSYEWCHEKQVSQFHVAIVDSPGGSSSDGGRAKQFEIQDVINVGKFSRRVVRIDDGHGGNPNLMPGATSKDGDGLLSGAVVVTDTFIDGAWCEEFGVHRSIDVEIRCCHDAQKQEDGSGGKAGAGGPAVLKFVKEHAVDKCTYRAQVCTPLLCADAFSGEGGAGDKGGQGKEDATTTTTANDPTKTKKVRKKRRKKNESIRDILDRALGNHCLQRNAGWWTYEFCHTRHAREFHGTNVLDAATGVSRQVVEEEHALGLYDPSVHEFYPDREEVDHVINATETPGVGGGGADPNKIGGVETKNGNIKITTGRAPPEAGGNGAVFVQEYTHGLVCDHSDVADSVIKGGNIVGGGIERSTTVRFSCGKNYELVRVNEDSTCHYIFDVTVPALCGHPLFKATVVKTQVVKCLPVDFAYDS